MRAEDERYFERLESGLDEALAVAEEARERGGDPTPDVEIPIAKDMADRVENILGIDGVADRVRELEGEMSREEAALELAADFAAGRVGDYETQAGTIEGAVRTAVALLTEGVVAAPIEGIDRVELADNPDGTQFVRVFYAGPIRSAGGTAQALSVLVADYTRALLDLGSYEAREEEVERYAEEVDLYDSETGLQYSPKEKETKFIARHSPVMLDGEATGQEEVSGFRDLERVGTNNPRGGMCLVLAEGIAQKAPKIERYTAELDEVDWPWLDDLIAGTIGEDDDDEQSDAHPDESDDETADEAIHEDSDGPVRPDPKTKYLRDLIAGRPVFGHPSEAGGFRLRYGRSRNNGFATAGVHPATMHIVDDFLATGTQLKTERPGKAAGVVPVDSIEGPTVRLANGDVRRIDDPEEALEWRNGVEAILDLGEYLVNYGEFVENNHPLAPASYTYEWWIQEFEATDADVRALGDSTRIDLEHPTPKNAIEWATDYDAPLHPEYTYCWHDISVEEFETLRSAVAAGEFVDGVLALEPTPEVRDALETLLIPHSQAADALRIPDSAPFVRSLGFDDALESISDDDLSEDACEWPNAMKAVQEVAPFSLRERAPTRIGGRMGRPEKSEKRELSPAVHTLFPIGEAGGSRRDVSAAAEYVNEGKKGEIPLRVGRRECVECGERTYDARCSECGGLTEPKYECPDCDIEVEPDESGRAECPRCGSEATPTDWQIIDIDEEYRNALETVGERESAFEMLKGVKGLTSKLKTPEPMAKGVLRAKHDVSTFKDGTIRYDMTDLPVTSVRPAELDVSVERFRELGYHEDMNGDPLSHDDQLIELKVQDIVLSDGAATHLLKTANFVDDLLADYYGLEPFYEFDDREDLVGELVFGMAPHTSAAVVGRAVGFTSAAVGYAHPYFHASKRRNCFHPETKLWIEDENGTVHHWSIETVVEQYLDEERAERDDFGTVTDELTELDGTLDVPSLSPDGTQSLQPVESISKHPAPDHQIRLETRSGRELTVTPDHEIHVESDGRLISKEARVIDESDTLATPTQLDSLTHGNSRKRFDLLAEFIEAETIGTERLMVHGLDKDTLYSLFEDAFADEYESEFYPLVSTADHLGLGKKTLSNYLYRESIPVSILVECFESTSALLDFVPDDSTLGMKHDRTEIDRIIEITERTACLLGYYAAEGFAREQKTSKGAIHQTTLCGTEDEARRFFLTVLREEFGVNPYEENHAKITASGRLLRTFFDTVLDAGIFAHTKRVPECMFDAPKEIIAAYLRGYFSGDGGVHAGILLVEATTVSAKLKDDIVALLTRIGIKAQIRSIESVPLATKFPGYYDSTDESMTTPSYGIRISSIDAVRFHELVGFQLTRKRESLARHVETITPSARRVFDGGTDEYLTEPVESVEIVENENNFVYCLTVKETHSLIANDISTKQCDGDEDCVMLLMDGLLNFSKAYLPDKRGGRMDAPLVMSSRIDPAEIDDEAHNMDIVDSYPKEFYEATLEMADQGDVNIKIAEENVGTEREYTGFRHTHDTSNLALGPSLSAYKTLGSMTEKMDAQLELARKLRAVDETDVAERIIEYHFLPDLIGNLRAFSRQTTRCLDCGTKYRRMPLSGECRECGGTVNLTVHEGSVKKYIGTATRVAEEFGCREYTKQRLEVLEMTLESVFENDKNKQSGIADFM